MIKYHALRRFATLLELLTFDDFRAKWDAGRAKHGGEYDPERICFRAEFPAEVKDAFMYTAKDILDDVREDASLLANFYDLMDG